MACNHRVEKSQSRLAARMMVGRYRDQSIENGSFLDGYV